MRYDTTVIKNRMMSVALGSVYLKLPDFFVPVELALPEAGSF